MPRLIAFHTLHDANVSICVDGKVAATLELERLYDVRYFVSNPRRTKFEEEWKTAIEVITKFCQIYEFDIAVTSWVMPSQVAILKSLVSAGQWVSIDHHKAHASLGFYDSPFNHALIFSYDGGGNDGTFNVFSGNRENGLKHLEWVGLNLGSLYRQLATAMPEVTRTPRDHKELPTYMRFAPLALSGKVMGYAALGQVRADWVGVVKDSYMKYVTPLCSMFDLGDKLGLCLEPNALDEKEARDLAATSQHVFEELLCEQVKKFLELHSQSQLDGIVLTGGCALNVHANQLVVERFGLPVHVPSAPNDCGISVGASWVVDPPKDHPSSLAYSGLPCWDSNYLSSLVQKREPRKVTTEEVAELLVDGAIIGVVRGRQEFGPRALGHRSMLCYPNKPELKDKLNKLKSREWFRPLCPSVAVESVPKLFMGRLQSHISGSSSQCCYNPTSCCQACIITDADKPADWVPASPFMSFAPRLTPEARQMFPAICHFDGTARLQTVKQEDEPWYHSLLTEVGNKNGGFGILLNTSFNVKGKPILNRINTALQILDSAPAGDFDYVLVEDWLFSPVPTDEHLESR